MAAVEGAVRMSLEVTITDIVTRLRQGRFANEQAVSQGIVLRILQELGWDTWDTTIVWPEFKTSDGRADYALCHPPTKPLIVIEVKQPGLAEGSVRQALEYAFHSGVPFVVLTDGRTWSFYLPAEQGSYDDRRVYKLDLFERSLAEAAEALRRYLGQENVATGQALEVARKEYRNRNRRSQARSAIPDGWRELVESGDETLVELLAEAVESKAGIRPDQDDIVDFLIGLGQFAHVPNKPSNATGRARRETPARPVENIPQQSNKRPAPVSSRRGELVIFGRPYQYRFGNEAMAIVLRELAKRDPTFLERCSHHPKAQGSKRRYIARSLEELYPDQPDLRAQHESLPDGWYVATNINNGQKMSIIRLAAEVAGLTFGEDIAVEL